MERNVHKLSHLLFQLRPFKIISVKNTETNASLSERDAIKQGVLDNNMITYTDKTTGKQVLIADAIQVNLQAIVVFHGSNEKDDCTSF